MEKGEETGGDSPLLGVRVSKPIGPFKRTVEFGLGTVELGVALSRARSDEQAEALDAFVDGLAECCHANGSYAGLQLSMIADSISLGTVEALEELCWHFRQKETKA